MSTNEKTNPLFHCLLRGGEVRTMYHFIGLECGHEAGDSRLIYTIQTDLRSAENKVLRVSRVCWGSPWRLHTPNLNCTSVTQREKKRAQIWSPAFKKRNHLVTDKHILHNWKHTWNGWVRIQLWMLFWCPQSKQTMLIVHKYERGMLSGKMARWCYL